MRFKNRVMLAVGCVSLVALSIPAFSRPLLNNGEQTSRGQNARTSQIKHAQAPKLKKPNETLRRPAQREASTPAAAPAPLPAPAAPAPNAAELKKPLFGWPALVAEARKYMGTNPTARTRLWCATFMNMVLAKAGYSGTNSDAAKSFADYGHRISEPKVGAIAVLTRGKNGGHVGVVSGVTKNGDPVIISGNHNKRVGESVYPRARVIAYVMPTDTGRSATMQVADRGAAAERGQPNMSRAGAEPSIDSPISELIAAIQAEQGRPERVRASGAQAQAQAQPQRAAESRAAPAPRRTAHQTPKPVRAGQNNPAFKSAMADLFGGKQRDRR